jgi:MFS transporter, DHA1 family, inner membrane transport protein
MSSAPGGVATINRDRTDAGSRVDASFAVIAASMVVGTAALMINGIQPALLGALTEAHRVTEVQLGRLATIEMLALALASAVGPKFLLRGSMRLKTAVFSLVLAGVDLGVCITPSVEGLFLLRGVAGLLEGLILSATIVVTIESRHPDRLNGIFWGVSAVPMALVAYLLPIWIVPHFGANGGFVTLAIAALISAAAAWFLIDSVPLPDGKITTESNWTVPAIVGLAAVFLQNAANGGAWSYLQVLADQNQFSSDVAAIAVSVGLLAQVVGALIASLTSGRFPSWAVLVMLSTITMGLILILASAHAPAVYLTISLMLNLFLLSQIPFQVRLLIAIDETRGAALLSNPVGLIGLSIGPSLCAFGVQGPNVTGAFWISAALMGLATACYTSLRRYAIVRRG